MNSAYTVTAKCFHSVFHTTIFTGRSNYKYPNEKNELFILKLKEKRPCTDVYKVTLEKY